jgi:ABC-type branched-subunit amino acid transport system ATPase component
MAGPVLEMRSIVKTFPGVKALSDVTLTVRQGEVHAICGENGAGKSTLMKVLSGVHPHGTYEGDILFEGEVVQFKDIRASEQRGIVIIHQELALSPYDGISIGILAALKSDGYGSASKPLPVITGQDAELASVKSIISGQQTQTVYKDTRKLAEVASAMVDDVLKGKKPEVNDTKTYDNGSKVVPAYLLQPVSVDKSNYTKELVDTGYYKASELN